MPREEQPTVRVLVTATAGQSRGVVVLSVSGCRHGHRNHCLQEFGLYGVSGLSDMREIINVDD